MTFDFDSNLRLALLQKKPSAGVAYRHPRPCEGEGTRKRRKGEKISQSFGVAPCPSVASECRKQTHTPLYTHESPVFDGIVDIGPRGGRS